MACPAHHWQPKGEVNEKVVVVVAQDVVNLDHEADVSLAQDRLEPTVNLVNQKAICGGHSCSKALEQFGQLRAILTHTVAQPFVEVQRTCDLRRNRWGSCKGMLKLQGTSKMRLRAKKLRQDGWDRPRRSIWIIEFEGIGKL